MSSTDAAFGAVEAEVQDRTNRWLATNGTKSVDYYHRELGKLVWNYIGMERDENGLEKAISEIPALKAEYYKNVRVLGSGESLNQSLEKAGRVADFFELAELKARDALAREESCGGHFRVEHQDAEGEADRDDENFQHVAAWEWTGEDAVQNRHKEELEFNYVKPSKRSYK
jgi:succinate dehydrogenase / fumarate reductase flavoprotein subunit